MTDTLEKASLRAAEKRPERSSPKGRIPVEKIRIGIDTGRCFPGAAARAEAGRPPLLLFDLAAGEQNAEKRGKEGG